MVLPHVFECRRAIESPHLLCGKVCLSNPLLCLVIQTWRDVCLWDVCLDENNKALDGYEVATGECVRCWRVKRKNEAHVKWKSGIVLKPAQIQPRRYPQYRKRLPVRRPIQYQSSVMFRETIGTGAVTGIQAALDGPCGIEWAWSFEMPQYPR